METTVLEVHNLVKKYGSYTAVNDISFSVKMGECVGFLGPNGAGKTTTIQILLGITLATSGNVKYFNKDFKTHKQEILQKINFASAFNTLQGRISVFENLMIFAKLYGVKKPKEKITELVEYFDSTSLLKENYWGLSAGQRTRINIIKALLNDPELILMDEPTASLDPDVADKTLSLIEELKKEKNISLLFTSHNMDEIARICDRVIFLDKGKIVAEDSPLNLTKRSGKATLQLAFDGKREEMEQYLRAHDQEYKFINKFIVSISTDEKMIPRLIFGISKTDLYITDIEVKKPTLEDFFLHIARDTEQKGATEQNA